MSQTRAEAPYSIWECDGCKHALYIHVNDALAAMQPADPKINLWQAQMIVVSQNGWFRSPGGRTYCRNCATVAKITPVAASAIPNDLPTEPPRTGARELDLDE
jgi:hypothetical protein